MNVNFYPVTILTKQQETDNTKRKCSQPSEPTSQKNDFSEAAALRLQNEFILREKTMAANLLAIEQINSFLIDLLKRMQQLNLKATNSSLRSEITGIIELIQAQINSKNWNHFESFYKLANNHFLQALTDKHPDLSPNEKRLCMLLQMNLSTKEISDITMQSCRAIEMARHRLRIKFGLSREDNIQAYLATFQ